MDKVSSVLGPEEARFYLISKMYQSKLKQERNLSICTFYFERIDEMVPPDNEIVKPSKFSKSKVLSAVPPDFVDQLTKYENASIWYR